MKIKLSVSDRLKLKSALHANESIIFTDGKKDLVLKSAKEERVVDGSEEFGIAIESAPVAEYPKESLDYYKARGDYMGNVRFKNKEYEIYFMHKEGAEATIMVIDPESQTAKLYKGSAAEVIRKEVYWIRYNK